MPCSRPERPEIEEEEIVRGNQRNLIDRGRLAGRFILTFGASWARRQTGREKADARTPPLSWACAARGS